VYKGCPFRLGPGACLIGRDPDICDIALDNPHLSRRHALVVPLDGEYTLIDFKSMNGVMVRDQQHRVTRLTDGDVIQLAGETLQFFREKRDRPATRRAGEAENGRQYLADFSYRVRVAQERGELLETALDLALTRLKATRGAYYRMSAVPPRRPALEVSRPEQCWLEPGDEMSVREEIHRLAIRYRQPIFTQDSRVDARFQTRADDVPAAAFSAMAVPVFAGADPEGLFYVEEPLTGDRAATFLRIFDQEDLEVLGAIAGIVAPALRRAAGGRRRTSSRAMAGEED
jgi:hypothetical protein